MTRPGGDQTRGDSTPFIEGMDAVAMSRGEISALCMKAARGVGMAWGLAEEAGFAASWLADRGIDGPGHLLAHLKDADGRAWIELCPTFMQNIWTASQGRSICPIALGATLCDHAALPGGPEAGCTMEIGPVDHPVLLLPFLGVIADDLGIALDMSWDGGETSTDSEAGALRQAEHALGERTGVPLRLAARTMRASAKATRPSAPPAISGNTIAALNAFAMRTTVPASAASRAGAGAGTTDND